MTHSKRPQRDFITALEVVVGGLCSLRTHTDLTNQSWMFELDVWPDVGIRLVCFSNLHRHVLQRTVRQVLHSPAVRLLSRLGPQLGVQEEGHPGGHQIPQCRHH